MADFVYRDTGMFTLFVPENDQAIQAWNQLAQHTDGTGKVLKHQANEVAAKLRKAGYTVAKHKPEHDSSLSLDDLLSELSTSDLV